MNRRVIVSLLALAAFVAFAIAALLYQRHSQQAAVLQASAQAGAMVRSHSPVFGPAEAPVTIVEFFDPACEACRAIHPHVKRILAAFPHDVRLVIRYTPFHRDPSKEAIRLLEAARMQGKFEPMLEALLNAQPAWANHTAAAATRIWALAEVVGIEIERARKHIGSGAADTVLDQDVADLKAIGVRSTPTFFVNGKLAPSIDPQSLYDLVESEVKLARK